MNKGKETHRQFCTRMVKDHPGVLRTDNLILFCKVCECALPGATKISHVKQHINSVKHEQNKPSSSAPVARQMLLKETLTEPKTNDFNMDLCKTFLEANIPLKKASHPSVKSFLEKYTTKTMPSESSLRNKYVPMLYTECIENLREKAKDKYIWVSIDETTDVDQRMVSNFIFGILDSDENSTEHGKCYLLNMAVVEAANASTMAAFFNNSLLLLWPNGKPFVKCILSENIFLI